MRLKTRFLLVLASFSVIMIVAAEVLARITLIKAAERMDGEEARAASARGEAVLREQVDAFSGIVLRWASRDDTYEFMTDRNPRYIRVNVVKGAFDCLRIHAFALCDTRGKAVESASLENDELRTNHLPGAFDKLLQSPDGLLERAGDGVLAGFAATDDGIWMVAAAPILDSNDKGPARGTLVMGRRVDEREQARLARVIGPSFRLTPAAKAWPPGKAAVMAISRRTLQTRVALADVFGKGRLAMEIEFPRTDYAQIGATLAYLSFWIVAVGAGVWLIAAWLLNRLVLRSVTESVSALRSGLAVAGTADGIRRPLRKPRDDEIGDLFDAVEAALGAIESSAREADRHRAEAVHSQRLAALGTVAAGVAHEINNPNGVINLNLNVIRRELGRMLAALGSRGETASADGAAKEDVARVAGDLDDAIAEALLASERITGIVSSLKSFARPAERETTESVALPDLVGEAVRWLRHEYDRAQCGIEIGMDPGLPRVFVNRQQFVQVFVNLLQNALQAASGQRGLVKVSGSRDARNEDVSIVVADNGKGMPPEDLDRAIDPFFTTRRSEGGIGLGLSISAAIVRAHGGSLRIESREGAGTTVTVTVPAKEDKHDNHSGNGHDRAADTAR